MKKAVAALCCLVVVFPVISTVAEEPKPTEVESRITAVTVYSDRSRVTRIGNVSLRSGNLEYAFAGLPGWLDESSVRLSLSDPAAGRITDVRIQRKYLVRAGSKDIRNAEDASQEILDKVAELDAELRVLMAKEKQIAGIRAFSMDKLPKDAAVRDIKIETYGAVVDFVSDSLLATAKARIAINAKRRGLLLEQSARQRKLAELRRRTKLEECTVLVRIDAKRATGSKLELVYMLPGATWEAVHELRATGESPQSVDLASYAVVTQTTGEDWRGAKISFSTQSPTKAAQIPELDALLLGDSQAVRRIAGDQHRTFNQALQRYRGQNTDWFNVKNPTMNIIDYSSNQRGQVLIEAKFIEIAKELEKRGTTAHFAGKGNPTIRGDGNPVRVQIGAATLKAASEIVAAPRASLNAARVVKMTNNSEQPFLPGRLSLYKDGAFLGVTDTEFVAQGESFSVFLGVADQVKLSRTIDQKRSSVVRGKKSRMQAVFLIAVENLSAGAMTLNLADRIPVSQRKDIRVYRVEIEPAVEPDSKGLLKWNVSLEAKEKKVFTIGYTVEYLQEVLDALNAAPSQSRPSKGNRVLQDINSSMMMIK